MTRLILGIIVAAILLSSAMYADESGLGQHKTGGQHVSR